MTTRDPKSVANTLPEAGKPSGLPGRNRRILVIEDDPSIAGSIVRGFKAAGYLVDLATDGAAGARSVERFQPDLIILDLNLPVQDGFEVLRQLKQGPLIPVFVVTARTTLDDRLRCFDLGAVDYILKPFYLEELLARARARLEPVVTAPRHVVEWDGTRVDLDAMEVTVDGRAADLTRQEFAILACLVERPGRAVARRQLAGLSDDLGEEREERTVDSHIVRIRKKLGRSAWRIVTVWGIGYRFERGDGE